MRHVAARVVDAGKDDEREQQDFEREDDRLRRERTRGAFGLRADEDLHAEMQVDEQQDRDQRL